MLHHKTYLMALVAVVAVLTTTAVAAPTWPTANLTYIQNAGQHATKMTSTITDGIPGLGKTGNLTETVAIMNDAALFFSETKAPAALAPVGVAGGYAAISCQRTFSYFGELSPEDVKNPFAMPMITTMVYNCLDAVQELNMEMARAVAAAGSYPPTK